MTTIPFWSRSRVRTLLLALPALLMGCGPDTDEAMETPLDAEDGVAAFVALEDRLTDPSMPAGINFDVEASGAAEATLSGSLLFGEGNRLRIEAAGTFGGLAMDAVLISDGERMFWTGGPPEGVPTPPALREAVAIGFTRMGILHNLARLSGGAPPDHATGGVQEWAIATPTDDRTVLGDADDGVTPLWNITVAGQPAGTFGLGFEAGEPTVRTQRVQFPTGIMQVVERYPAVAFGEPAPAGAFDTTPLDPSR